MGHGGRESGGVLRRRWLVAGVLLVGAVLFHDLAMTAGAHEEAVSPPEARSSHARHASVPAHIDAARAAALHDPIEGSCDTDECHPPEDCRVGLPGVLAPAGNRVPIALDVATDVPDSSTAVRVPLPDFDPGTAPLLPPGVRRAMLQVFLI